MTIRQSFLQIRYNRRNNWITLAFIRRSSSILSSRREAERAHLGNVQFFFADMRSKAGNALPAQIIVGWKGNTRDAEALATWANPASYDTANGHHRAMTIGTANHTPLVFPRAWSIVPAIVAASLAMTAPASAQSAASRIDQPTPATVPSQAGQESDNEQVAPPSAIRSSTDVMKGGAVQGDDAPSRTDPIQHLPKDMR